MRLMKLFRDLRADYLVLVCAGLVAIGASRAVEPASSTVNTTEIESGKATTEQQDAPGQVSASEVQAAETRLAGSVQFLASDDLEGRGLGSKGIDQAADYLAAQFAELGLKTSLYDGTPFQSFPISIGAELGSANEATIVGPAGEQIQLESGVDFMPLAFGGSGEFDLPLVFVGYGITAKDEDYDDYAGIDVTGKAVIVLRHEPQQDNPHSKFDGTRNSAYAPLTRKISNAYEHGAAGVIFCSTQAGILKELSAAHHHSESSTDKVAAEKKVEEKKADEQKVEEKPKDSPGEDKEPSESHGALKNADPHSVPSGLDDEKANSKTDPLLKFKNSVGEGSGRDFPVLHCRRKKLNQAVEGALNTDLTVLEKEIDEGPTPHSRELTGWRIKGRTDIKRDQTTIKNVVGVLEGEGPQADETIVIGAHYDHLGRGADGSLAPLSHEIHNGADDNASGTAALLEVARRLATRPGKLPRRIVFIAFTGEERGLLGSEYYVKNPLIPIEQTIAMLNMDMVGRLKDDKLIVYGTGTADELNQLVDAANEHYHFNISKQASGFGPSDQTSFYAKKIPVLHFFTGIHSDYHRPSDDSDKVNVAGMNRIADLVAEVAVGLAEHPDKPQYKSTGRQASFGGDGDRPFFGSIPDFGQAEPGYALSGVTADSPAEKAGLKGGDRIVKLGESKIGNLEDFDSALRKHKAGEKIPVVVSRDGQEVTLEVTLAPPR